MDSRSRLALTRRLLEELRTRKEETSRLRQPVAIIGMACRFPGGPDLDGFQRFLASGGDAVTRGRPGTPAGEAIGRAPFGAYLKDVDRFDAEFFRIAPVEAELLDPQQRLLLETCWESLEAAALNPAALSGSHTGVYCGISTNDYQEVVREERPSLHRATGTTNSAAIGRVAFTLGLEGPAITVDTACSSSLVAIHLAVAALQRGEADLALAGGVNAMLTPGMTETFEAAGMLAPDGRCKTFDAAADGYVRGEGCGVLVLKRLPDAERDGDRILGVVVGSAVNQDGASAGLTVPNGPAQERVIRDALERARISPSDVDYLEAHGTGTELGDPIEVRSAASAYGKGRDADRPLLLGSVKTNIGHLEAAAGVAGVIKVLLAMREGVIPKHLHFDKPTPRVDWEQLPVRVVSEATPWPSGLDRPVRAGVSSFGYSGTNAHLILEAPATAGGAGSAVAPRALPAGESAAALKGRRCRLLPLSGRSRPAVQELADRYREWLDRGGEISWDLLSDAAWTAGTAREHFRERAGLAFTDVRDLEEQLASLALGEERPPPAGSGKAAFLYTGQGSQWAGMGRDLYEQEPVVRKTLDRAEEVIREERGESLLAVMFEAPGELDATEWTQPALFALQGALTALWKSVGVEPAAVFGHSVGELAAAHAAGVFGFDEGLLFAARRGALMGSLPRRGKQAGGMLAVFASRAEVTARLASANEGVPGAGLDRAADNGGHQVVSGPLGLLSKFEERLREAGIRAEPLSTSHAFHSGLMDPVLDGVREAAPRSFSSPAVPLVTNVNGRILRSGQGLDGAYWRRQARSPVLFADGVRTLSELGVGIAIEIGPRPVLGPMASACWPAEAGGAPVVFGSLDRAAPAPGAAFGRAVSAAYQAGLAIHFEGLFAGESRRRVSLPTYPFQRRRFWVRDAHRRPAGTAHPFLGVPRELPTGEMSFEAPLSDFGWMSDHRVFGRVVAPGTLFGAQAVAASAALGISAGARSVADLRIERPLVLSDPESRGEAEEWNRTVQLLLGAPRDGSSRRRFRVFSRSGGRDPWVLHAVGEILAGAPAEPQGLSAVEFASLREALLPARTEEFYRGIASVGLALGPVFRGISALWAGEGEALAEIRRPEGVEPIADGVHPALLDTCLQLVRAVGGLRSAAGEEIFFPVGWERLRLAGSLPERFFCHARLRMEDEPTTELRRMDSALYAVDGTSLGHLTGLVFRRGSRAALLSASAAVEDLLYGVEWRESSPETAAAAAERGPAAPGSETVPGAWVIWPGAAGSGVGANLGRELERRGQVVALVPGEREAEGAAAAFRDRKFWEELFRERPGDPPLRGVVHAGALEAPGADFSGRALSLSLEDGLSSALALVQGLHDAGEAPASGLSFLTRGGQAIGGDGPGDLVGAALWGFGRVASRELPGLGVRLVDLDPSAETAAGSLADALLFPDREPAVLLRGGKRRVPRLVRLPAVPAGGGARVRPDRTYLVTGGLGGLGLEVAGWLADQGAGGIVLNGRRPADAETGAAVAELAARGTQVRVEVADVRDRAAVDGLVARIGESGLPPLGGVIHSAGVWADASLPNQDWDSFARVLGPKALGAWHLHRATLDLDLDLFVVFSSFAGWLGNPGQSNYAAANAFLDQLAGYRRALGLPGQSVVWGPWSEVGEAAAARERVEGRLSALGAGWLTPEQGLAALSRVLEGGPAMPVVASMDWEQAAFGPGSPPGLLEELALPGAAPGPEAPDDSLAALLRGAGSRDREEVLVEFLRREVQSVLRLSSPPAPEVGFFDLGMDSAMAVDLGNRINRALAGEVAAPNTAVFDYPDIRRLARRLAARFDELPPASPARTARARPGEDRIAVVGMGCRLPGGASVGEFWNALSAGKDAVTRGRPGDLLVDPETRAAAAFGAYLSGMDRFDAEFFRVAPLEAESLDPQQRLLLETSWEALEDAALDSGQLAGSRTGVYVGITDTDYQRLLEAGAPSFHHATGNSPATAAGRIAFTLGLQGPAFAVDTACSSSLVALHQAAASLQRGETDLALAGGVNAILTTAMTRRFELGRALAPDGRCKTFDAAADGYVRGEGCGILVLKRLGDAERDGDRILGVLLASAVNQDGASAGLTAPNGPAQEAVIREALARAGIPPAEVDYLEAHGTGTELGDPIEVQAAAAVYGEDRDPDRPLLLGSVKTNIGHLEAAAGVAGVIKVLLAMRAGVIPKHLHFHNPNPKLDWDRLPVRVTSEPTPWPERLGRPARAGVSSFGFSGTNAHVILERYGGPDEEAARAVEVRWTGTEPLTAGVRPRRVRLLPLAARSRRALAELAGRHLEWTARQDEMTPERLADGAWTAGSGRRHFTQRKGLVFTDRDDLREQLAELAAAGGEPDAAEGVAPSRVAFLFTGQGSQWPGMGRDLYEHEPVARAMLDRAEAVIREERGESLLSVMFGVEEAAADLGATEWTQPALYALQGALVALWRGVGIEPDAVLGHSVGEIAAAHAAGVFGFEEGLRFAARRGALMGSLPQRGKRAGGMLAVFAPGAVVASLLEETNGAGDGPRLEVAADNGTHQAVSGPRGLLSRLEKRLRAEGLRVERLPVSHGFHSALMDPVLAELDAAALALAAAAPAIPLVSNLTGREAAAEELRDGGYWGRQARAPVRFREGVGRLSELGVGAVLELGPRETLGSTAALAWPDARSSPTVIATQEGPGFAGDTGFLRAVATAFEAGLAVSFRGVFVGESRRRISIPSYPFQRERYWVRRGLRRSGGVAHPLLGERHGSASGEAVFESRVTAEAPLWLSDHRVFGRVVAPGAFYGSLALAALEASAARTQTVVAKEVRIERPLVVGEPGSPEEVEAAGRDVQLVLGRGEAGSEWHPFEVFSRAGEADPWVLHAAGRVGSEAPRPAAGQASAEVLALIEELVPTDPPNSTTGSIRPDCSSDRR